MQALDVLLRSGLLSLHLVQAGIAYRLDVLDRCVVGGQKRIVLLLPQEGLLDARIGRSLVSTLLRVELANLHALGVEHRPLLLRVLRGNTVAVAHNSLLVGPAVSDALAGAAAGGRVG